MNNNFYEELKKYFDETPREKVLEDWKKSKKLDEIGPTVETFISSQKDYNIFFDSIIKKNIEPNDNLKDLFIKHKLIKSILKTLPKNHEEVSKYIEKGVMKIVGSEWVSDWFWLEDKLYELSNEDLQLIFDSTKDNNISYCSICRGCGEEGCCSPLLCKQHTDGDYCETNLQHLKFGYMMYDKIMKLIGDDKKYKEETDKIYDETYDKIYRKK